MGDITFKQIWDTLTDVKVEHLVEEKMNLSYLSWSRAWFLLCELYPQAEYVYHDTIKQEDGTCSVGVTVKIGDCKRFASLPVMDYKMNAIVNPDARQINDGRQRCFVKAIAMFGLGIPSSRSLMLFGSNEPVMREETERGAMIVRTAKTHIRFGHFEYFHHNKITDGVKTLLDHVIDCYYPDTKQDSDKYLLFFDATVKKTAHMVSAWQSVGFNHGVMNTDNMSILGETFDYGPYAFMENYDPNYICNHTDSQGRYSFSNQPKIAEWNCYALASALIDIYSEAELRDILSKFNGYFYDSLIEKYRKKLGLKSALDNDYDLLLKLFEVMETDNLDYTNTFRDLSKIISLPGNYKLSKKLTLWISSFKDRLIEDENTIEESISMMNDNNPKYILRNYLAQSAIEDAEIGKSKKIDELAEVLRDPYIDQGKSMEHFCKPAPEEQQNQKLSCSS